MEFCFSKLQLFLEKKKLKNKIQFEIQNINFQRVMKKMKNLRNIQISYRTVQKNRLLRFLNHWIEKTFTKISVRNILQKIFKKNDKTKILFYFQEWTKITKQKKQFEEKQDFAKQKSKLKAFDSWNICLIRSAHLRNLMKKSDHYYRLKILRNLFFTMKNYLLQNKDRPFKKTLENDKLAVVFLLRKKLKNFKNCLQKKSARSERTYYAMKLGNQTILRKLFLRWYIRMDLSKNHNKRINCENYHNNKVDKRGNGEFGKYSHRNKIGNNIIEKECDKNIENKKNSEERNLKNIQNFMLRKSNNKNSFHIVKDNNFQFLKSWETEDGRRLTDLRRSNCRNKYLLLASIKLLLKNRNKSKKKSKEKNILSHYLSDQKKKLFIRVLLQLIRRKHEKLKIDKIFIIQSNENKLSVCFNKLSKNFILRWTESQRVRLSDIYYRKFALRKFVKKLANIVKHLKRKL